MSSLIVYINRIAELAIGYSDRLQHNTSQLEKHLDLNPDDSSDMQLGTLKGLEMLLLQNVTGIVAKGSSRLLHLQYFVTRYIHFRQEIITAADWTEKKWRDFESELTSFYEICSKLSLLQSVEVELKLPGEELKKVKLSPLTAKAGAMKSFLGQDLDNNLLVGDWKTGTKLAIESYRQQLTLTRLNSEMLDIKQRLDSVNDNLTAIATGGLQREDLSSRIQILEQGFQLLASQAKDLSESESAAQKTSDAVEPVVDISAEITSLTEEIITLKQGLEELTALRLQGELPRDDEALPQEEALIFTAEHLALLKKLSEKVTAQDSLIGDLNEQLAAAKDEIASLNETSASAARELGKVKDAQSMRFFGLKAKPPSVPADASLRTSDDTKDASAPVTQP